MTGRRRAAVAALFAAYLLLLVWVVLWKAHVPFVGRDDMREIKLIPFAPSGSYGASSPFEVLANLLIFVPFGAYLAALVPGWPLWRITATAAGASLALEAGQYVLATGSSDVTDLLVNTAGALAGVGLLAAVRRRLHERAVTVVLGLGTTGTVVAVIAVALFVTHLPQIGPMAAVPLR